MVQKMEVIWLIFEIKIEGYLAHGDKPLVLIESALLQVAWKMACKNWPNDGVRLWKMTWWLNLD